MISVAVQAYLATLGLVVGSIFHFLALFILAYELRQGQKRNMRATWILGSIGLYLLTVVPMTLGFAWIAAHRINAVDAALDVLSPIFSGWAVHWIGVAILRRRWGEVPPDHNRPPPSRGTPV